MTLKFLGDTRPDCFVLSGANSPRLVVTASVLVLGELFCPGLHPGVTDERESDRRRPRVPLLHKPSSGADGFHSRDEPGTSQRLVSIPAQVETSESNRAGKGRATLPPPPSDRPQPETLNTPSNKAESTTKENAMASRATLRQAPPPAPPPSTEHSRLPSPKSRTFGEGYGTNPLKAQETERCEVASRSGVPTSTTPMNDTEEAVIASSVVDGNNQTAREARSLGPERGGVPPREAGISRSTEPAQNGREPELCAKSVTSCGEKKTAGGLTGRVHENQEWPSFSRAADSAGPSFTVSPSEEGNPSGLKEAASRSAEEALGETGELLAPGDAKTTARAASILTIGHRGMEQTVLAPDVDKRSEVGKRSAEVAGSASQQPSVVADTFSPAQDMGTLGTGRLSNEAHEDNLERSISSDRNMAMMGAPGSGLSVGARSEPRGVLDVPLSRNGLQDVSVDPLIDSPAAESGSVGNNGRTGARGDVGFGIQTLEFAPADVARGGLNLGGKRQFATDGGQDQTASQLTSASLDPGWIEASSTQGGAARDGAQQAAPGIAKGSADNHARELPNTSVPDILSNVSHLDASALENQSPAVNPLNANTAGVPVVSRSDISSSAPFGLSFTEQLLSTDEVPGARSGIHPPLSSLGMNTPTDEQVLRPAVGSTLAAGAELATSRVYAPRPNGENQAEAVEMPRTGSTGHGAATTLVGVGPHVPRLDAVNQTRAIRPAVPVMTAAAGRLAITSSETASTTDALGPHAPLPGGAASTDGTALARGARPIGPRPGMSKPGLSTVVRADAAGAVDFSLFSSNGRVTGRLTTATGSSEKGGRVRDNLHPGQIWRPGGVLPTPLGADNPAETGGSRNSRGSRSVPSEGTSTVPRALQPDPSVPTMSRRDNVNVSGHHDPSTPSLAYAAQPGDPLRPLSHFRRSTFGGRVSDSGSVSIFLDPGGLLNVLTRPLDGWVVELESFLETCEMFVPFLTPYHSFPYSSY